MAQVGCAAACHCNMLPWGYTETADINFDHLLLQGPYALLLETRQHVALPTKDGHSCMVSAG